MPQARQNLEYDEGDEYLMGADEEEEEEVEEEEVRPGRMDAERGTGSDSDDESDVLDQATDTSAAQAERGKDIQGIPWEHLHFTRERYRETRLQQYKNYENLNTPHNNLDQECRTVSKNGKFYDFRYNTRAVKSTIVHFQLRNLVWATSKHDVYVMYHYAINHWSPLQRNLAEVLNLGGPILPTHEEICWAPPPPVERVQISTMCAKGELLVAGGFHGELVCKRLNSPGVAYCSRITSDNNAITNAIDVFETSSGSLRLMTSNNDSMVRVFDCNTFAILGRHEFEWPVNHTSLSPDGKLVLVVGDDPEGLIADSQSGKKVASLKGHLDFSFSSAFHPNGQIFATGNQDTTCRLWDLRYLKSSLLTLKGRIGAIRSIRFTADGRFMAMSEPADFVHIFDTKQEYKQSQEIDLFGEVAGISFSPDTEALFIGVADRTYSSLLEFNRHRHTAYLDTVW